MSSCFAELIRAVSGVHNTRIKKSCEVLFRNLKITEFYYYKIGNAGQFTLLGSNVAWGEYVAAEKLYERDPYFRHPKNFRDGVVLLKKDAQDEAVREMFTVGEERFDRGLVLQIVQKRAEGVEVFGFASKTSDEGTLSMLLSELSLLRLFTENFRKENQFLFSKLEDNQIDFAKLIGPAVFNQDMGIMPKVPNRQGFLKTLGMGGVVLTAFEQNIIQLLLSGYPASQIARVLHRSKRTVEHRIERVKEKLVCHSRAELIQKGRELETLGYFEEMGIGRGSQARFGAYSK